VLKDFDLTVRCAEIVSERNALLKARTPAVRAFGGIEPRFILGA